jgi:hypothetical protein
MDVLRRLGANAEMADRVTGGFEIEIDDVLFYALVNMGPDVSQSIVDLERGGRA